MARQPAHLSVFGLTGAESHASACEVSVSAAVLSQQNRAQSRGSIWQLCGTQSEVLELNVGGTLISVRRSTLTQVSL